MKTNVLLAIASLLSILFFTFHLSDDIVRGIEKGGVGNLSALPTLGLWLYAALVLGERRLKYIIILLASLLSLLMPIAHMTLGHGLARIAKTEGGFFFVWTLIAVGATALFSVMLSVRGLWSLRRGQAS